jgi:hypothetical protein
MRNIIALSLAFTTFTTAPAVLARPVGTSGAGATASAEDRFFVFTSPQAQLPSLVLTAWQDAQGFVPSVSASDARRRLEDVFPGLFSPAGTTSVARLEADLKAGLDAFYDSKYADAEKRLAEAVAFALAQPESLAAAPASLGTKLADGAAVRYRNALKMKADKVKALGELERFIRHFPTLGLTLDDHPPEIGEEWQRVRGKILADAGGLAVAVQPSELEAAGAGCELLVNGASAGKVSRTAVALPTGRYLVKVHCTIGVSWPQIVNVGADTTNLTVPLQAMLATRVDGETGGLVIAGASDEDASALVTAVSRSAGFDGAVVVHAAKDRLELGRQDAGDAAAAVEVVGRLKNGAIDGWKPVAATVEPPDSQGQATRFGIWPWVAGGAGVAGLLVGVGLNVAYENERQSGNLESLDGLKTSSIAGYVAGGLLLATGAALYVLDDAAADGPSAAGASSVSAGARGLTVRF